MLRYLFNSTIGLSLVCIAGCGDPNAGALFIDMQYATRCDMTHGCDMPHDHDLCGFSNSDPCVEGDPKPVISCSVSETETERTISFSARQQAGASISVTGLTVTTGGMAATGGACRVSVSEGANNYAGACGGSDPSEAQPCRINNISFFDDMGNPTLAGDLYCQFLENSANPTLQIEVTAPGTTPTDIASPAHFRLANCAGLTLP